MTAVVEPVVEAEVPVAVEPAVDVPPRRRKRGDVQGLRALAVALVVADHMGIPGFGGGFLGVDVFFVISGFLITGLVLHEAKARGGVSLVGFYARRARRVLPAATLVLLTTLVVCAYVDSLERTHQAGEDALWAAGFLANIHFALQGTDYFASSTPSLFQHYWSLAVEEQFYLVWPLLLAVLVRLRTHKWLMLAIVATATAASFAWSLHVTPLDPTTAYFNTLARGFELGGGACLAVLAPRFPRWLQWTLGLAGAAGIAVSVATMTGETPFPGWQAGVPVLATMALLAAPTGPISQLLRLAPLRALGTISFSVYLWHWPVLQLAPAKLPAHWSTLQTDLVLAGIILGLSTLSWLALEVPFQRSWIPLLRRRGALALWPVTIGLVVAAVLGANAWSTHQLEERNRAAEAWQKEHPAVAAVVPTETLADRIQAAVVQAKAGAPLPAFDPAEHRADFWRTHFGCYADNSASAAPACVYGDTTATRTVVVQGDSHAGMWLPALDQIGKAQHFRIVPLVKLGCAPFFVPQTMNDKPFPTCAAFRDWAVGQVKALRPDAVIVGYRGLYDTSPWSGQTMEQTWTGGVRKLLTQEVPAAGKVVVLGDIPTRSVALDACATTPGNTQASCLAPATGSGVTSNPLTQTVAAETGASFVDTVPLVCADGQCPAAVGEAWTYFDEDHLSASWASSASDELAARIGSLFD
ncbi:acyltransferase family protein [Nocardioides sp. Kera G14]|uniref:acyltransferase family protein n=1 Tax=Nocardioides sp. Kera G14 TaxID=2884264 RepID=UPI001D1149E6|nr:acyltransferase family protein [Nocardioides sp. Kera G14]UDY24206.1 acyltransferase [Nocardioides sp. Kera G14]